jgi:guanine nucleotide-binding protein subunit alpha
MDAIIFLAPISAFDQTLAEEPTVNRLVRGYLFYDDLLPSKLD